MFWGKIGGKQVYNKVISPAGSFKGNHKCSDSVEKLTEVLTSLETTKTTL